MHFVKYRKTTLAFHVHSEGVISIALSIRRTRPLARATWRDNSMNIADANTEGTLKVEKTPTIFMILDNSVN